MWYQTLHLMKVDMLVITFYELVANQVNFMFFLCKVISYNLSMVALAVCNKEYFHPDLTPATSHQKVALSLKCISYLYAATSGNY
jgi:hypothetical protein